MVEDGDRRSDSEGEWGNQLVLSREDGWTQRDLSHNLFTRS